MRKLVKNLALVIMLAVTVVSFGQNKRSLNNYREPGKDGINVFEAPKDTAVNKEFEGVKVRIGGSSALQFQALDHENSNTAVPSVDDEGNPITTYPFKLKEIGSNFNLATANLDLDVQLHDGLRMHLRTYLSSRHHPEPYVKGGYLQIDNLNFLGEGTLSELMKYVTVKIGHMENNYGDAHFRRSDNAQALYNPFVGNLIMDAFTTEVGAEVYYRNNGFIGMIGFSNGKLNQNVNVSDGTSGGASFLAKAGYDKQFTEDLRFRLTGSLYTTGYVPSSYLYSADRTGSRYYGVTILESATSDDFRSGRYNPNLKNKITAIMINPFVKYQGLEFFGTFEMASGKGDTEFNSNGDPADNRKVTQFAGEVIYRFGANENFFVGARYNKVSAEDKDAKDWSSDDYKKIDISRFQASAGWFLTKNVLAKLEYVTQSYDNYADANRFNDAKFNGIVFESVISF